MPATTETLTLERDYSAAPERVFAAWTNVALLRRWFGCAPDKLWTMRAILSAGWSSSLDQLGHV